MDKRDIKLEQVAAHAENFDIPQTVPIFEIFVSLVALGIAMILFAVPDFMRMDYALYHLMNLFLSQSGWGMAFAFGGAVGGLGLLLKRNWLRVIGLILLSAIYGVIALCYVAEFPTIGAVVMSGMSLFSMLSIPIVRYTGLGTVKGQMKKNKRGF